MSDILRYRGDIAETIDRDHMIRDFGGRYMVVRNVAYDPATDLATVTMRGVLPDEFRERIVPLMAIQAERERIRELFNG